jgi:hypothetical protein
VDESSIGGKRQLMEATIMISFDPTGFFGIRGLGHHKYWPIGAWSKYKSPSINFSILATLRLERLGSTTWGALVLMIICKQTHGSNVISPMSSTTILGGLTSWSIYVFKMLFNVYCGFNSIMTNLN